MTNGIHPAPVQFSAEQISTDPILHFFHYAHLPAALQSASAPFCALASHIVTTLPRNAERTVALRKLLEAKDAAVRANVGAEGVKSVAVKPTTHVERMEQERRELETRLNALRSFFGGAVFESLSPVEQELLRDQSRHMEDYLGVLTARLENAERKTTARQLGEPVEIGGHDIDRDGPVPFGT